jgi:rSAM/selenodomain-associated transferase 1
VRAFCRRLVVMAKAPIAGRAKTRLARELGLAPSLRFVRHASRHVLERVARDPRWQTMLAVTPDSAIRSRLWPTRVKRMRQGHGDLGTRMQRILDRAGPGPVVIIGTDIPTIRPSHIARAFALLGSHDAVFGPAQDGGYWLVGLRRSPCVPEPFREVRWSTSHALSDTLANLQGLSVARLEVLTDVDDGASYATYAALAGRRVLPRA